MWKTVVRSVFVALIAFILSSFAATEYTPDVEASQQKPLRIGVTPNYPPMIFNQGNNIAGAEADLARALAEKLNRPAQFVKLRWEKQIPALLDGKTDIIMSGMSVTKARKVRINFTDHYLKSGLVAMMHIENAAKYNSIESIKQGFLNIGVVEKTTSETFIKRNFTDVQRIATYQKAGEALMPLKNRSIDIFVHDAPSIMWVVSENESDLAGLWEPLNEEYLAWGVSRGNEELLTQVNTILRDWKKDGTLRKILLRWLPEQYLERFK